MEYDTPGWGTLQRASQSSLMIESVSAPFGMPGRFTAGADRLLDYPDLGGDKRPLQYSHRRPYPSDRWSTPLTSESDKRNKSLRQEAKKPPAQPLYSKRSIPNVKRTPNQNSKRINKAVRSDAQFKGLLHLEHVGEEPDEKDLQENGQPPLWTRHHKQPRNANKDCLCW